ncbi:MAG: homocysteine S-methyltransferase family protein [Candidatus Aminicenantes bacterium]|nr:MAG: homocysteine S-methyltransferase family protein [Candidatus Aminicenantes bacterium]
MSETIFGALKKRIVLLDGGMGTELIAHGFPQGGCPESWNVEKPDVVQKIHKSYFDAGSDAVLTNSFGGSQIKLESYDLGDRCYELNLAAARNATEVRPEGKFVGGSIGPIGKFLSPVGDYEETQFEAAYAEQAKGLADGGVDFLLIETQYDLMEALCALQGARHVTDKPVFVTMTFKIGPRRFFTEWGNSVNQCVGELEKEGVPIIGINCTLDSEEMVDLIKAIRENTSLSIIAQANAGKPSLSDDGEVSYEQSIEDYIRFIPDMIKNGASIIGGCCGTNPEYIKRMAEIIKEI